MKHQGGGGFRLSIFGFSFDFLIFDFLFFLFQKSSFSKFDALQKKNILHVRSSDAGKAQEKFNVILIYFKFRFNFQLKNAPLSICFAN